MRGRTHLMQLLFRLAVSGVFAAAAILKMWDWEGTLVAVHEYGILSWKASEWVASGLPCLELAAAAGLWIPRVRRFATAACAGMTVVFVLALGQAWARGLQIQCACFGGGAGAVRLGWRVAQDALLLGMCAFLWKCDAKNASFHPPRARV